MAEMKNDQDKMGSNQNKGSGSDTVSAAKISAGSSVGNVGESPMPHTQGSGQGSQGGMGQSGMGASGSSSGQSSTLASHTSSPMGGGAGSTGAGTRGAQGGSSTGQQHQGQSGQGQSGGMGDTMKQTASQAQDRAGEAYEQASEWARDTYESAASWASDTLGQSGGRSGGRSMRERGNARQGVQNYVAQNPVMVGLVGLAAGLLLGALLPRTRREDETFGEWADEVRQQGMRYAHEMTQRGREYVDQSFSGDDDRFSRHESEFGGTTGQGPGAGPRGQGANRH